MLIPATSPTTTPAEPAGGAVAPTAREGGAGWRWALGLIALVTAARLVYVLWGCPYGLAEDEAYYWLWSKHLDWSYLTKGPGVALTIALGTLTAGDTEGGVRLTAPIWGALLALGAAGASGLLSEPARRGSARFWGAGIALLSPPMQITSILMTIDGPMLACWALATWAGVSAMRPGARWSWLGAGAAVGVGLLFKPTIAIVMPGLLACAMIRRRALAPGWWAWAMGGSLVASIGLLPLVIWNATHDWAMLRHLGEHLRAEGGGGGAGAATSLGRRLGWVGEYVGLVVLLGGPALVLGAAGLARSRADRGRANVWFNGAGRGGELVIALASIPVLVLYLAVSVSTRVEGNWALGGLVPLLSAAGAMASRPLRGWTTHAFRACVVVGLVTGIGMLRLDVLDRWGPTRGLAPLGRVMSGPMLAEAVIEASREVAGRGEVLVISEHYGTSSLLAFYLARAGGSWRVTCRSTDGKRTQFDLWKATRLNDPSLDGRDAILVGGRLERWATVFDRVENGGPATDDSRGRRVFVGRGLRR